MTVQRSFVKDLLRYLPSRVLPALTAFITTPILTHLFVPVEFGYWALAAGVAEFFLAFATSSFGSAAIRYYPLYKEKSQPGVFFAVLGGSVAAVIVLVSGASLLLLHLLRDVLPAELYPLLLITIPIFVLQGIFTVFLSVARSQERSGLYTTFQLLFRYGSLGIGLLLVVAFGFGVEGLLWGTLLALAIITPFLVIQSTRGIKLPQVQFRLPDARQVWRYVWPLALGNVAMWGLRLSDRYIISYTRPASEVGLYSVAYNISGKSIDILVALFLLSVSPMMANLWEGEGRQETESALTMVTRLYLILCLPAATGLAVLASPLIDLLAADAYHDGYRIVGYVAFASFFWGLANIAQMGVIVREKAKRLGANQIVAAGVNFGLNLFLVPRYGFVAAGIVTLVGFCLLLALHAYASRRYLTWRFPLKTLRNVLIAASGMGLLVWAIYSLSGNWREVHWVYLPLSIAAGVPFYFGCLWVLGEANGEEKAVLRNLWHKVAGGVG